MAPDESDTGQVDPETPTDYTGAGVGKPVGQQIAEQDPVIEEGIEEDVEEDVEEGVPVEDGPTTPTQRQFQIDGPDQTGQKRTITVWAEDENDAFAKGKEEGVTGTKVKKTKEKNTFQEDDAVEDDAQQEEQPAPEEQPSPMSSNEQAVQTWINQEAELRGVPPEQIAGELGEDMDVSTKGDSVEGAAARIANNNKEDTERETSIDEQLDAVGKEEAPVAEATQEEAPQYDESGFDQDGVTEDGRILDPEFLLGTDAVTLTIEEAEAKVEELDEALFGFYDKADADEMHKLKKRIKIAKQRQGKTTTEAAPTQEEAPRYDESGFDQGGVTEDGRINMHHPLYSRFSPKEALTVEQAEAKLKELKDEGDRWPELIESLEKQIEIAKQRQGKTAPETAPTQETTQEETQKRVDHAVGRINKINKKRRKNARPTKVVEPTTEEGQRAVELAESLGVKLIFVDNMLGATGMAFEIHGEMTGVIAVRKGSEGEALFRVVFHELAHGTGIDKIDLGLTKAEMDDLLHEYVSRGTKAQQAEARQRFKIDPERARREAVATLMGRIATDPDFRAAYAKDNPTTFGKIVDAILEFFNLHPEAKLSKAQRNLLSELRKLHKKSSVEAAATFESSLEDALDLSPEQVQQEAKKRKLSVGGQSTEAQRKAVADDMHKESLADSVEMDPDIITERVQDNLRGKKLEDPGDFTADDFDVLEQIGDDSGEAAPKKKPRRRPQTNSGQYIGAPKGKDTTSKLRTMLDKVEALAKEGEYGRFWYERSSQQILNLVKGDKAEAEKLVMAIAITSSSTPVAMNFDFALQAYNQWKAGKPITTGRFPKAMGPKLQAAFEGIPWEGIKTNHFYTNLMRRIDPSKVQGVTHDIWMMRAFGHMQDSPTAAQYEFGLKEIESIADKLGWEPQQVQAAVWVAMKAKMENSDVKKATEAESVKKGFMTYVTNKKGKKERKILNEEEHRKIWFAHANKHTATEADKEGAKFDYKNASEDILAQISHETKPGRATNHLPELFDAPYEQQVEFHQGMSQVFLDDSGADYPARVFSILSPGDFEAPGFYKSTVSPGTQMLVVAPKGYKMDEQLDPSVEGAIRAYAAVRGILQKQDSVGYHRAFFNTLKRDQNGVEVQIGRPFTEAEIKQLADAIKEKVGHDEYSPISTPNGVRLIEFGGGRDVAADLAHEEQLKAEEGNPEAMKELKAEKQRADRARGVANKKFRNIIQEALSGIEMEGVDSAKVKAFAAVGGEVKNNWEVNKNGEGYMADGFRGRPDLLGKARDIIGELHEKVQAVEDEFAQKYGWTKNEEIGIPQEKTLEQIDNETAGAARNTTEMHEKFLQKVEILITGGMDMNEAIQQITDEYIEASVKGGVHRDVAASRAVKAMGAVRGALGRAASKNASTVKVGVENVPITVSSANSVLQQLLESHESETQLIHPDPHAQMSQFRDAIHLVGDSVSQLLEQAEAISLAPAQAKIRLGSQQQAIMTLAINYIQMELRADSKRLSRAKSGSPEARNIAARQLQNLETLERFVLGNQRLGTETARALQLRQGKNLFDNLDLDPIEVLALATEMKGKPLTPEEKAEINKTVEEQKARAAKAKAARQKVDQAQAEATFNKEKERPILGKDGKPKKVNTRANVAQIKKLLSEGC